jgi:hypothetical protein
MMVIFYGYISFMKICSFACITHIHKFSLFLEIFNYPSDEIWAQALEEENVREYKGESTVACATNHSTNASSKPSPQAMGLWQLGDVTVIEEWSS